MTTSMVALVLDLKSSSLVCKLMMSEMFVSFVLSPVSDDANFHTLNRHLRKRLMDEKFDV